MPVINNEDVEWKEQVPGMLRKEWVNRERGSVGITMGEVRIKPGADNTWHTHKMEDVGCLRSGEVTLYMGDEVHKVRAGMTMLIPAGVRHRLVNTGNEEAHIIFCFPTAEVGHPWGKKG